MSDGIDAVTKQMQEISEANIKRAKEFAEMFTTIKVTHCGTKGGSAMAAHHNNKTGWGFTAQFMTTPDLVNHVHAFTEFVGMEGDEPAIAEQFKKIVGG